MMVGTLINRVETLLSLVAAFLIAKLASTRARVPTNSGCLGRRPIRPESSVGGAAGENGPDRQRRCGQPHRLRRVNALAVRPGWSLRAHGRAARPTTSATGVMRAAECGPPDAVDLRRQVPDAGPHGKCPPGCLALLGVQVADRHVLGGAVLMLSTALRAGQAKYARTRRRC